MRQDRPKGAFVENAEEYFRMLADDSCELIDVNMVNRDAMYVSYKTPQELLPLHGFVSHVVASFITAYARIHMWKLISRLDDPKSMVYMDTGKGRIPKKINIFMKTKWIHDHNLYLTECLNVGFNLFVYTYINVNIYITLHR